MTIEELFQLIKFRLGDTVEYDNKIGKDEGKVIEISFRPAGIVYGVVWSNKEIEKHYDFELKKKV